MPALSLLATDRVPKRWRHTWWRRIPVCGSIGLLVVAACALPGSATCAPSDLDKTWGQNGIVTLDGTWLAEGKLQSGRDLVVSYQKKSAAPTNEAAAEVVRLDGGGRVDASFGAGGRLQPNCSTGCSIGSALDVMPDGRLVTQGSTGFVNYGACSSVWMDRFLPDGQPDASFGTAGRFDMRQSRCRLGQFVVNAWGEALYTTASWLPAGYSYTSYISWIDAAGTMIGGFGFQTDRLADGLVARWGYSGALAADDKKRVWAAAPHSPDEGVAIVRFLDRQLDSTFGIEGRAVASVPGVVGMDRIALDNLGRIIVTGIADVDGVRQMFLVRFIDRGSVDTGFGVAGVASVALARPGEEVAEIRLAVLGDGRIVVAATVRHASQTNPRYPRVAVARLLPDGLPDLRFAGGGVANLWTQWGTSVQFVAVRPAGEIIVGGNSITAYPDGNPAYVPVIFQLKGGDLAIPKPPRERRAMEYFHAGYGHYFMTADADEIASLDTASGADAWTRTGLAFDVWDGPSAEVVPVCRFWSDQSFAPKSSHFYTPYADECAFVKTDPTWLFERNAFYARMPEGTPGARICPPATQPLYRAYNNGMGGAPNHRYTKDPAVLDAMIAQGWIMEGEAATRVFACVPASE